MTRLIVTAHRPTIAAWSVIGFKPFVLSVDGATIGSAHEPGAVIAVELPAGRFVLGAVEDPTFPPLPSEGIAAIGRPPFAMSKPPTTSGELTVVVEPAGSKAGEDADRGRSPAPVDRIATWWKRGWSHELRLPFSGVGFVTCKPKVGNHATWFAFYETRHGPPGWPELEPIEVEAQL